MKQFLYTTALLLAFCFISFAQEDNAICPEIKINAPESIFELRGKFRASASFENDKNPSESKFNWIVIKNNDLLRKYNEGSIEIETDVKREEYKITILAENLNSNCQNPATASVIVVPNIGSPYIIDTYSELSWNDERARLDNIVSTMQRYEDSELFAWISFDKKTFNSKAKPKLLKILNHLSMRGLKNNRVTFMISEADLNTFRFQPVPQELVTSYYFDEYIIIRGEDLEKLSVLF